MHARARESVSYLGGSFTFRCVVKKAAENGGDASDRLILCYNCIYKRSADSSRKWLPPSVPMTDSISIPNS